MNPTVPHKTLDQQRATHAWEAVERQVNKGEAGHDYAREARKLPIRIMASGLGQALVFIKAKASKKESLKALDEDLSSWVEKRFPSEMQNQNDLLQSLLRSDAEHLRRTTAEVLSYLQWLTRFAQARGLGDKEENDS